MTDWEKFDEHLQQSFPEYDWGEPVAISLAGHPEQHYACRLCIARYGLKAAQILQLPTDPEVVRENIREAHVILAKKATVQ
jgi:hypothetical protein